MQTYINGPADMWEQTQLADLFTTYTILWQHIRQLDQAATEPPCYTADGMRDMWWEMWNNYHTTGLRDMSLGYAAVEVMLAVRKKNRI